MRGFARRPGLNPDSSLLTTGILRFDYFGVLISVIMGLALTHLLRGLGRLMQLRYQAQPYWVHIVWTVNALI